MQGIGASTGVAIGSVHLVDRRKVRHPKHHVPKDQVDAEIARFQAAVAEAIATLKTLKERAGAQGGPILEAHLLMLEDPLLVEATKKKIRGDLKCAEWAVKDTIGEIRRTFDELGDAYFRERRSDVDFVGERILQAMSSTPLGAPMDQVPDGAVVVAHDISPADVLSLYKKRVRAFVTEVGGTTSHTAILARALEIPAVVGCAGVLEKAGTGDDVIVDGNLGEVVLHPSKIVVAKYRGIARQRAIVDGELLKACAAPATTPCGTTYKILANIDVEDEVQGALSHGADGVGLFRTEFLYIERPELPSEDEHAAVYGRLIDALAPGMPATLRTFDLGSDKLSSLVKMPKEPNPALGLRASRLGVARPALLRAQLRGMLRATSSGRGSILLPMIGSVEELREVKGVVHDEMDKMEKAGLPVRRDVPIGIMVELPSAVWVADRLAAECDFFSIGTNDLIQYSLAIDRANEHVAYLYQPLHAGILRAIAHVVAAGRAAGIAVNLCGEMAADPLLTPICMGLGFDALSMPQTAIPRVKWVVRRFPVAEAKALVDECVTKATVKEIEACVAAHLRERVPELVGGTTSPPV